MKLAVTEYRHLVVDKPSIQRLTFVAPGALLHSVQKIHVLGIVYCHRLYLYRSC